MIYKTEKPVYLQIADYVCERILQGVWKVEERIPSVRELGVTLSVNLNTVTRSLSFLESKNIIFQSRGVGYFVERDGVQRIRELLREQFLNEDLPDLFRKMQMLDISIKVVEARYVECCC